MSRPRFTIPLALGCALLACDPPPAAKERTPDIEWNDTPDQPATGPTFDDEDFRLEVKTPRVCDHKTPLVPAEGLQRLSVPIVVKAKTARALPVSPLPFTLEDEDGHTYRATLAGCAPTIPQTVLKVSQSLEGEIAFDVPKDIGQLELVFEPFLIGREKVTARVSVP